MTNRQRSPSVVSAMPNRPRPRYYWDSCVLLAYINNETDRWNHVEAMMDAAADGKAELFTSMLSIVEVAFAAEEKSEGQLSPGACGQNCYPLGALVASEADRISLAHR